MKKYEMQIKMDGKWSSIRPTGGSPYQYDTEREARRMLKMCYPDQHLTTSGAAQLRVIAVAL